MLYVAMRQNCISVTTTPTASMQLELMSRLAEATSVRAVAAVIAGMAQTERSCKGAMVIWGLGAAQEPESEPAAQLDREDLTLARAAAAQAQSLPLFSTDERRLAIRLFDARPQTARAVLLIAIDGKSKGQQFVAETTTQLEVAGRHLLRALESADLQDSLKHLRRSESLQRALFAISELSGSDRDMQDMLLGIHAIVGTLMYAENFFIVLHDAERDSLRFLYYSDTEDSTPRDAEGEIPMQSLERSPTWYLLRDGRPLMGSTEQLRAQVSGPLAIIGPDSQDWLGVPMMRDGQARGAVVVQSYRDGIGFSIDDRTLLEFVGDHILIVLERKQSKEDLEQRVRLRTMELADANKVLQLEIVERQRAEHLQTAFFQIAELANTSISQADLYCRVHEVVGRLLNAENFFVALLSDDRRSLCFPYYAEGVVRSETPRPLERGMSEYALRLGKTLRASIEDMRKLERQGEIQAQADVKPPVCWLSVPLLVNDEAIGLIVVQSRSDSVVYRPADVELLNYVGSQIARTLQRRQAEELLQRAHVELKQRVEERTEELHSRNAELEIANAKLKSAQDLAVQSEKLASIGLLAAGVAHEINNPIGYVNSNLGTLQGYVSQLLAAIDAYGVALARTGSEALTEVEEIRSRFDIDFLTTDLRELVAESREGIDRVCKIVRDLKNFSRSNQDSSWMRADINAGLDSTLNIVSNQLKYKAQIVTTFGDLPLVECLPSELNQVFLNILVNAGQAIAERGMITVSTGRSGDKVWIAIGDDGEGIPADVLPRIFDPFFTTKPVGSGTGLGMAISYGIVAKHHGTIEVASEPGHGTLMRVELPIEQPN